MDFMTKKSSVGGVIRSDEAYSKHELMERLGISQRFWDKMLDDGLPYAGIGHAKWVHGARVLDYIESHSEQKPKEPGSPPGGSVSTA